MKVYVKCAALAVGFALIGSGAALAQANPSPTAVQAVQGQCQDPWVAIALNNNFGRGKWHPRNCAINRYNNGRWNSFSELNGYVETAYLRTLCPDPWVAKALNNAYGAGQWGALLCTTTFYGGGSWGSFDELNRMVAESKAARLAQGIKFLTSPSFPQGAFAIVVNGTPVAVVPAGSIAGVVPTNAGSLIGNDSAGVLSHNGSTLVGNDGASLVGNDGGSIVAAGGGNIVAAGGGNLANLPVATFGPPSRALMALPGQPSPKKVSLGPNTLSWRPR